MRITGSYGARYAAPPGGGFAAAGSRTSGAAGLGGPTVGLREFARRLHGLRDAQRSAVRVGAFRDTRGADRAARAVSLGRLAVNTRATATTRTGIEEVNTVPTSFGPTRPSFVGGSSSDPIVGGVYDGAQGDDTLTVRARFGGIVGLSLVRFDVEDGQGQVIETIDVGFGDADDAFALSNGLELSFSGGTVQAGDTFTLDVFASVGSRVRTDVAFDRTGPDAPGFDPGVSVGAGSFQVNGVAISVAANDTIDAILQRITASAAGVVARFDEANERVELEQRTLGPDAPIDLGADSSGFLAAVKLAGSSVVAGRPDERAEALRDVAAFAGVTSGLVTINGVEVAIDAANDTLLDVLRRIEESGADVEATFDERTGRVNLRSTTDAALVLDDGDTGFFAALAVTTGEHRSRREPGGVSFRDADALRSKLGALFRDFDALRRTAVGGYGSGTASGVIAQLDALVGDVFEQRLGRGGEGSRRSGLGIDWMRESDGTRTLELSSARLRDAVSKDAEALADFLFAEERGEDAGGLLVALGERLDGVIVAVERMLGPGDTTGLRVDRYA